MSSTEEPVQVSDGRHARSERTRTAIVDALLALIEEGDLRPPSERVAERAGVSRRALFNHFRDVDDLLSTAAQRRMESVMARRPALPLEGATGTRLELFVASMQRFFEYIRPVRRAAILAMHDSKDIAGRLREAHRHHRAAVAAVFAQELDAAPPADRASLLASLAAAASFSTWEELRTNQELSPDDAARAVRRLLAGLLLPGHAPEINLPAERPRRGGRTEKKKG